MKTKQQQQQLKNTAEHINKMAGAAAGAKEISLNEFGEPPEPPSVDDIIDDIQKASLDDIVFQSSTASKKSKTARNKEQIEDPEDMVRQFPKEDHRKELTPKMTYEMSLKFLERSEDLQTLLNVLKGNKVSLESWKNEILQHLDKLKVEKE